MHLINIPKIAFLNESLSPTLLWKQYALLKSAITEKYCQNSWPH